MKVDNVSIILIIVILMLINKNFKLSVCSLINSFGLSNLIENFAKNCDGLMGPAKKCCKNCDNSCDSLPGFAKSSSMSRGECGSGSGSHGGSVITNTGTCSGCLRNNCGKSNAQLLAICGNPCSGMALPVVEGIYEQECS